MLGIVPETLHAGFWYNDWNEAWPSPVAPPPSPLLAPVILR
jgi:hypothetical protein